MRPRARRGLYEQAPPCAACHRTVIDAGYGEKETHRQAEAEGKGHRARCHRARGSNDRPRVVPARVQRARPCPRRQPGGAARRAAAFRLHRLVEPRRVLRDPLVEPDRRHARRRRLVARRDPVAAVRAHLGARACARRCAIPPVQRRHHAAARARGRRGRLACAAHAGAAPLGARVLRKRGPPTPGADRPRPGAPVPAGPQQVAQFHHPARRQGRVRPCLGDHDPQGAARAAARDSCAGEAGAAQAGVRPAVFGDPRASRGRVSRTHRLRFLAVPRDPGLGPVGRRARGPQPAPGAAHGADAAPFRQRRPARDPAHLSTAPRDLAARAVRAAERGGVPRQRPGQPRAPQPARRPAHRAEAALAAVHARTAGPPAQSRQRRRRVRRDPPRRHAAAPSVREFRAGDRVPAPGRARHQGGRDPHDAVPHGPQLGPRRPAGGGGAARQGSHGHRRTEGALRRGSQHLARRAARVGGCAGRLRRGRA